MKVRARTSRRTPLVAGLAGVAALALLASSCSLAGGGGDGGGSAAADDDTVVLLTHSDFVMPDALQQRFESETGLDLQIQQSDSVGALVTGLVDDAGRPAGDVAFGVDNTFASRTLDDDVFASYGEPLPPGVADFALEGDDEGRLVPVDSSDVCVNVDTTWFAARDLAPPRTLEDLTDPDYRGLLVTPSAAYSSTGLAFLLASVSEFGEDGWEDYWTDLMANDTLVVQDWTNAYQGEFTQGGEGGDRPIVVSYASSPPFTVGDDGEPTTEALLDTCYGQVEYAGVLEGAAHPEAARELVDFLVGDEMQAALPEAMYVYPVAAGVELPADWAQFAPRSADPRAVDPAEIEANRQEWLTEWTDLTTR